MKSQRSQQAIYPAIMATFASNSTNQRTVRHNEFSHQYGGHNVNCRFRTYRPQQQAHAQAHAQAQQQLQRTQEFQQKHCLQYSKTAFLVSLVILLMHCPVHCTAQQQKFRETPVDLLVTEGTEAMMRCEVSNQAGAVQWTKDGFALGFSAVIPGFPRYSVLGDRKRGIYNLRISNVSIMDDAEYQCQVGPARLNSAIRANAKLTVISPPSSIEIEGYTPNSKVEVRENQDLTLKCTVANAKPKAEIIWYRGNVEYNSVSGLKMYFSIVSASFMLL
ncbi:kin of IRRE-like protein 1 [Teleopsis dalmanni]|uniref:kin of IRRE-like protein 1 n=1 Tax=Teleopsis dalmanni TaxID=139649 RepID=UPI0018CDD7EA|nr:kin of IRRE-like protein 1 [Teleopsis dalmanni]